MALLGVEDLSIAFGGLAALSGVSFAVREGEIFALIGPNGAGKTTVFNVLTGLYRPSGGRVTFGGADLLRLPPHAIARRGLGRTFQNTEVFRHLSVLDNVLVGEHARLCGTVVGAALWLPAVRREERAARARARALLERLGLADVADVAAGNLPLGRQKRLEMARALAAEPRLLLLDEPAGGLAPRLVGEIFGVVRRVNAAGVAVLLVEQNARAALRLASRGYVLETGRVAVAGPSADLARDPRIRSAYLGLGATVHSQP